MSYNKTIRQDMDETARLILMDNPSGLVEFCVAMQKVYPDLPLAGSTNVQLWAKYRGMDGRTLPTHDYVTGEKFR